jgi:hypothetical protein
MFLILFRSDTVEIYEQISSRECGVDQYGKPRKCIRLLSIVDGDLQPASSAESRDAFGTKTNNSHKLYLDLDVKIENTNILKVNRYRGVFEIIGDPQVYNKFIPHQLVLLRHIPEERMVRI